MAALNTFLVNKHGYLNLHSECKTNGNLDARFLSFILCVEASHSTELQFYHSFCCKEGNWAERRHHGALHEKCYSVLIRRH